MADNGGASNSSSSSGGLWSSLASGIGSAAVGLFGNLFGGNSKRNQKRQHRMNMELAKYEHDLNMEAWREQNEYNSPASQMQRFQDAGLNPYLIYGKGDNGNSTSVPQYNMRQEEASHFDPTYFGQAVDKGLQAWLSFSQFEEQKKNNATQRAKTQQETLTEVLKGLQAMRQYGRDSWEDREAYKLGVSQAAIQFQNLQKTQQEIVESQNRVLTMEQEYSLRQELNPTKMLMLKEQLKQLQLTNNFAAFENSLYRDLGISPKQSLWQQLVTIGANIITGKETNLTERLNNSFLGRNSWNGKWWGYSPGIHYYNYLKK